MPGLIAYRFDAPLFFANADYFLTQVRELIAAADAPDTPVECLVIDAEEEHEMPGVTMKPGEDAINRVPTLMKDGTR